MPTLADLITAPTAPALKAAILAKLAEKGFPVTDWIEGGVERTRIEVEAEVLADVWAIVPVIAGAGFLEEEACAGPWLDLYAFSRYGLTRTPGVFTRDTVRLTCAAGSGPVTFQPGQLWATDANGLLFNNEAGGVLVDGGTLDLVFQAESLGAAYNLARGAINKLVTSIPGVTITNIVGGLVTTGADLESDAKLKQRCRTRWATLGSATRDAYLNWALSADPAVTRVYVDDTQPRGQGTVNIMIAGDTVIGGGVPAAVQAYVNAKKPITDDVLVTAASAVTLAIAGSGKVKTGKKATAQAAIAAAIAEFSKAFPIGGTLYRSALVELLMLPDGMVDAQLTIPATASIAYATNQFPAISIDFNTDFVITEV